MHRDFGCYFWRRLRGRDLMAVELSESMSGRVLELIALPEIPQRLVAAYYLRVAIAIALTLRLKVAALSILIQEQSWTVAIALG